MGPVLWKLEIKFVVSPQWGLGVRVRVRVRARVRVRLNLNEWSKELEDWRRTGREGESDIYFKVPELSLCLQYFGFQEILVLIFHSTFVIFFSAKTSRKKCTTRQ